MRGAGCRVEGGGWRVEDGGLGFIGLGDVSMRAARFVELRYVGNCPWSDKLQWTWRQTVSCSVSDLGFRDSG